jgi:hypothetical protein
MRNKSPQTPVKNQEFEGFSKFVRMKGLEPPRLTAPDPKSGAAANYATSAFVGHHLCFLVEPAKKERKFIDYSEFRIKFFRFNLVGTDIKQSAVF